MLIFIRTNPKWRKNNKHVETLDDGQLRALLDEAITYKCPKDPFLLSEEPMRGAGGATLGAGAGAEYVATVRCVNPSPLAERRKPLSELSVPRRRSKPAFPMTYTARATLEIGSGSVGSGRAVTTTTASNQVRTPPTLGRREGKRPPPRGPHHTPTKEKTHWDDSEYIDKWYRGLGVYGSPPEQISPAVVIGNHNSQRQTDPYSNLLHDSGQSEIGLADRSPIRINPEAIALNAPHPKLISKRHIPVVVRERDVSVDTEHSEVNIGHDDEINVLANKNVIDNEDVIARKKYRERVGKGLVVPTLSSYNPKNVRSMTIGKPLPHAATSDNRNQNSSISRAAEDKSVKDKHYSKSRNRNSNVDTVTDNTAAIKSNNKQVPSEHSKIYHRTARKQNRPPPSNNPVKSNPNHNVPTKYKNLDEDSKDTKDTPVTHMEPQIESKTETDTELVEMVSLRRPSNTDHSNEFSLFIANQQRLLQAIETNIGKEEIVNNEEKINKEVIDCMNIEPPEAKNNRPRIMESKNIEISFSETKHPLEDVTLMDCSDDRESDNPGIELAEIKRTVEIKVSEEKLRSAEVPSDASIFLTLYKRLLATPHNIDNTVVDVKSAGDAKPVLAGLDSGTGKLPKKKKDKITSRLSRKPHNENSTKKKDIIRNALKKLFFDNITQSDSSNKLTGKAVVTASTSKQVDSAIPFSCITTPEVVASCTTTASAQAAAPLDTKVITIPPCFHIFHYAIYTLPITPKLICHRMQSKN
ncbi:hypothetical protein MSG28_005857 [Choristoneura fumiferana]|uniref:Uncharacterized protein n=1 Tax=Choristoneura fumiferana TaxID=7141 RepID=A0ACC0L135_CHOFU|nr:hypothetical protein MSG28_005857 [Choristoneura fumiferana]